MLIRRCKKWSSYISMPEPIFARCSRGVLLFLTTALTAHSGMQKLNCAQVPSLICVCVCVSNYAKLDCVYKINSKKS